MICIRYVWDSLCLLNVAERGKLRVRRLNTLKNVTLINIKCALLWGSEVKNGAYKVRGDGYLQDLIETLLTIPRST